MSSSPIVFISRSCPLEGLKRLEQQCKVTVYGKDQSIPLEDYKKAVVGADALFVHPPDPVNKEILDLAGPQLKVVGTMSVGLDHVDLDECKRRGIKVGHTPDVLTIAVAEMAVALTLTTARRIQEGLRSVRDSVWGTKWENALWLAGKQVSGSVIGIVGLGRIGFQTAKRLKAFEPAKVVYCGHNPTKAASEIDADFVSFKELLQVADIVIATCSLNKETVGLFNAEAFKTMKNSAIFINITRGSLVNQDDLYDALIGKEILAAGLDVTSPEPLPTDHKLLTLPNCVVTPHLGSATAQARNAMCELTVDNILAGLDDKPLPVPAY